MEESESRHSSVTVDIETKREIDRISAAMRMSRTRIMRAAVQAYLKNAKVKKALEQPAGQLEVRA